MSKDIISKELLIEVLKLKQEIKNVDYEDNEIVLEMGDYIDNEHCYDEYAINIHELAHDNCKAWAWDKGYIFGSGMALSSWGYAELFSKDDLELYREDARPVKVSKEAIPEAENVIRLCQWILDNIESEEK